MAIPPAANEGSEVWQGHIGVQTFFKKNNNNGDKKGFKFLRYGPTVAGQVGGWKTLAMVHIDGTAMQ